MHKLIGYICDELEELERKTEKDGKLSMTEVQYMDLLAHTKKNLLKGEEMMDNSYSMDQRSMDSRRNNRRRDSMGRYSGEGYRRSYYDNRSYANDVIQSIRDMMDSLPADTRRDAQRLVNKLEEMG